ncbi:MAG: aspartate aminotransferase family protein [Actinobacteria bacterium]|nr:aspartate aminotransferase family protein [Actinomycetota bacterium]
MDDLISLDQALDGSRKEVREWYNHINPPLASFLSLFDFDRRYLIGQGVSVWDKEGTEYYDFLGGYGSLNLGHNHPKVAEALSKVSAEPKILQATLSPLAAALAKNLSTVAPGKLDVCFFCNSGAEAVEAALKTARAATKRRAFVSTEGSFHGKTMGALSVSGRRKYRDPFEPLLADCLRIPYGDAAALDQALSAGDVAAFIVEPIQGEGGVIIPPDGYLRDAEKLCRKYGALLIVDEVQTGMGRTGKLFAFEHEEIEPDIITLAKSLGGGCMPIGCMMSTRDVWNSVYGTVNNCLLHTSTFMNNTMACAAGIASLEVILEENLIEAARAKGDYFLEKLKELEAKHPMIKEVRGRGLMIGLEFYQPAKGWFDKLSAGLVNKLSSEYFADMMSVELLGSCRVITAYTLNNPNVIRLQPPLIVGYEQLDYVADAIDRVCEKYKSFWGMTLKTGKSVIGSLFKK